MELELTIHREPWVGTYLRVKVTIDGREATADLNLRELRSELEWVRDDED